MSKSGIIYFEKEIIDNKAKDHVFINNQKLATINNNNPAYFILSDHLNSSSILVGSNGQIAESSDYKPFGSQAYNHTITDLKNDYTFTDKELDEESTLQYFGARYMDNEVGRFVSVDPVLIHINSIEQVLSDPQSLNSYTYSRNNPVIFVDRDGNFWVEAKLFTAGFINAWSSNNALGFFRGNSDNTYYSLGQSYGDIASIAQGITEMIAGGSLVAGGTIGGIATSPTGVGALAGAGVATEGIVVAGHGASITGIAFSNLMNSKGGRTSSINKEINWGKQNKHIPGTNNYREGRSILTHDNPQNLVNEFSGKGTPIYNKNIIQSEVVDFGENIGYYVNKSGSQIRTNIGSIHYSKSGTHIVPEKPNYFSHH